MSKQKLDKNGESKVFAELQPYYSDEYLKLLNLGSIKNKVIRDKLAGADLRFWSHKNRIVRNIQIMKHTFLMEKTNMITTCFKATYKATSCIYGYLYSRHIPSAKGASAIEHAYIANSPTYRSQDGEYRHRLLPYAQFDALWIKYYDVLENVEEMIIRKMNAGKLEFQTDFYYPSTFTYSERKFEGMIDEQRLPIKLFAICWLFDFYQIHNKVVENHVNPAYQYIIYQSDDVALYDKLIKKLGHDGYRQMTNRIQRYYPDINGVEQNIVELEVGQKIFPLTIWEAIKLDDINFNVWREIYFTNMCSNLVLNMISPSFPFINNWFYIQNAHGGLFDNIAMHEKYRHSDIATDISSQLKNIDKFNYVGNDMSKGPINNRFLRLSKYIQKSIMYVDSSIKLTELAICMTSEYVGRTLRDIPVLVEHAVELGNPLRHIFTDLDMFMKHIFEFIYGFYCMNTKAGIFHGDLHMNNATVSRLYTVLDPETDKPIHPTVNNPRVVYAVAPDEIYMFRHLGAFSTIIDYSRAIMGNHTKLEHEFGARFADQYFREQRFRVMQIIYHYFPKIMDKYREQIEGLLISNFPLMFKILSTIDTFVICSNLAAMLQIDDAFTRGKIKLANGIGKFLVNVIQRAEALILNNLQTAIDGKLTRVDDMEWPNLLILQTCFEKFRLTDVKQLDDVDVLDIFNYNNDVKYDIEDYNTWGPMLSLDKEIELRKKYGVDLNISIERWLKFKDLDESMHMDNLISKYEAQERDLIQFESWMLL